MKGETETDSLFLGGRHLPGICGEHFSKKLAIVYGVRATQDVLVLQLGWWSLCLANGLEVKLSLGIEGKDTLFCEVLFVEDDLLACS
ncbi:hypothetical protein MUK42_36031 [Musa troglodytarum]|uniref:Uncharacterized protein n=1 Tax=Musa troglodytarum TaxID=320322 RepID=A0A9E7K6R9_9LILI|nr:hypothetical protein MUK42_36031 [Musa troglodytarum]